MSVLGLPSLTALNYLCCLRMQVMSNSYRRLQVVTGHLSAANGSSAGRTGFGSSPSANRGGDRAASDDDVVIVAACRTPICGLNGQFASLSGPQLGGAAISGVLSRAGVRPELVEECLFGCVLQVCQINPGYCVLCLTSLPL